MTEKLISFDVKCYDKGTNSIRILTAVSLSGVLDKAYALFIGTWKRPPERIDITLYPKSK